MKSTRTTSLASCLSVAVVQLASAQSATVRAAQNEFAVAVGAARTQQRDATASPFEFDGTGYQITTRYRRTEGRTSLSVTFDGGRRHLTPAGESSDDEQLTDDELRVALRWSLGDRVAPTGLALGVDAAGSVRATSHAYADPSRSTSDFLLGAVTLGPSLSLGRRVAGGRALAECSVPLAGLVDHPYSDARNTRLGTDTRVATFTALRGIAAGLSYATGANGPIGIETAYRLRMLRYDDVQPTRSVSQSLSVGLVTRFGARPGR